jgi:hypothetical protein
MAMNARQRGWVAGVGLQQISPGLYVDEIGSEYFYLTGIYSKFAHHLLGKPLLNSPKLISRLFDELRSELQALCCTELMD